MAKITNLIKKIILNRAKKLAIRGQQKFGGNVSEYLDCSLKISWDIFHKSSNKVRRCGKKVISKLSKKILINRSGN